MVETNFHHYHPRKHLTKKKKKRDQLKCKTKLNRPQTWTLTWRRIPSRSYFTKIIDNALFVMWLRLLSHQTKILKAFWNHTRNKPSSVCSCITCPFRSSKLSNPQQLLPIPNYYKPRIIVCSKPCSKFFFFISTLNKHINNTNIFSGRK